MTDEKMLSKFHYFSEIHYVSELFVSNLRFCSWGVVKYQIFVVYFDLIIYIAFFGWIFSKIFFIQPLSLTLFGSSPHREQKCHFKFSSLWGEGDHEVVERLCKKPKILRCAQDDTNKSFWMEWNGVKNLVYCMIHLRSFVSLRMTRVMYSGFLGWSLEMTGMMCKILHFVQDDTKLSFWMERSEMKNLVCYMRYT